MPTLRFPNRTGHSDLLGRVRRPLVTISIFSQRFSEWIEIQNLLAGTGADLTLLPSHLGEVLLPDIRDAKSGIVRGIVPGRTAHLSPPTISENRQPILSRHSGNSQFRCRASSSWSPSGVRSIHCSLPKREGFGLRVVMLCRAKNIRSDDEISFLYRNGNRLYFLL